jgi:hypothetical protein
MPSAWHDAITWLFSEQPTLAARVLREWAGAEVPADQPARLEQPGFNDRPSTDFSADVVVTDGPVGDPVHASIVEAQRERVEAKRQQLARYAAALWLIVRCPVDVLVICPDQVTADWYARPIETSLPGYLLVPRGLGPRQVPVLTDPQAAAASPAMAVLSVAMHGQAPGVAQAFMSGLASMPPTQWSAYYESAHALCTVSVRRVLEDMMSTTASPVSSPFAREHFGRGKAEGLAEGKAEGLAAGEAEAILLVLHARGLEISPADQARIAACNDLDQLRIWVARAVTATAVSDLFR